MVFGLLPMHAAVIYLWWLWVVVFGDIPAEKIEALSFSCRVQWSHSVRMKMKTEPHLSFLPPAKSSIAAARANFSKCDFFFFSFVVEFRPNLVSNKLN